MHDELARDSKLAARLRELQAQGVDTVRITYADLHGVARGKDVPLSRFANAVEEGVGFCSANLVEALACSLAKPLTPEDTAYPDMRVRPLPATLVPLPWEPSTAWCLAGLDPDDPFRFRSPRHALERAVDAYRALGLIPVAAAELEFYVLKRARSGRLIRLEREMSMVYTMGERGDPSGFVRSLLRQANRIGLDATTAHHECGQGQYEINLNHCPAVEAADRAFRFKHMAKELARHAGLNATFMAKPFAEDAGSGFHLHLSLHDERGNRFFDPAAPESLSKLARWFIAGILAHASALTAFYSPTVNSYKRLVPGTLVPLTPNWGWDNRNTYLRVPQERSQATRLELRAPDASANLYLVTAATLFAGLDGIQRQLQPAEPVPATYWPSADDRLQLPCRLEESLQALRNDAFLVEAVGQPLVNAFSAIKNAEADRYRLTVTEWELNEYSWHL
jgi:glutamine synthetase